MGLRDDQHIDFSLSQKETLILPSVTETPRPNIPIVSLPSKKPRSELQPLHQTTTVLMQAIRRVHVECLPEYFEQTCNWRQHETAVICGSSQLTYQELDLRANRLAHFLVSRGVGEGNPVGILLERSLDTYIALLGVLKAGAAFVPLDPSFSSEQVAFIAKDAELRDLVTTSAFRGKTNSLSCPVLELDQEYETISVQYETRTKVRVDPASLCYIIYKLDAAGQPTGVAVSHTNIVNFLRAATLVYRVRRNDRVYQGMSIALDFSFAEIWPTWIAGATLVTGLRSFQRFGYELTEFLVENEITVLYCVPPLLASVQRDVPTLRSIIVGGTSCPAYLVSRWARPGRRMLNTYGCVETTVMATWCELFPNRPITLGSPLSTYYTYILDDQLRPVEDGKSGEICIGGSSVALGYLNRPDLMRERFIPNPVWRDRELVPLLYCTGDLGRVTPAGEIAYLGKIGSQAKGRGELGVTEQVTLRLATPASFSAYASASALATGAIFEAETSKLETPSRRNLANVYELIMTDPLYRNSLFTMASTFMLGGLGFVFWIIIARLYKPESVGIATTLISIMTLLSSFTILGFHSSLNRYLPKTARKNELINTAFMLVTFSTILVSIIFFIGLEDFSPQLLFLRSNAFYIISFTIFVIFCSWNILVDTVFMAFRSASNIFIKNSIISISKLLLPFALIALAAYGIFASAAAALVLGVLISLIILALKFKIRPLISINISLIKETLAYSFANYIVDFMLNMPSLVLPVIILNVLSAKYAAYYYVASMIQTILQVIPLSASQALLTEGSYNEAELKQHVKKALGTILVILIPAVGLVVLGGGLLLQTFGKNYATEAFQFLQLYSASTIATALLLIANAIMNVKHQVKSLVILNVAAAILTLWLSYAFISGSLIGVGWGWTLGQGIAGFISLFFIIPVLTTRKRSNTTRSKRRSDSR